ncbi:unnamed protein product, partial [Acidithrix sp. C25]
VHRGLNLRKLVELCADHIFAHLCIRWLAELPSARLTWNF